jgi:hypothetical protein
MVAVSEFSRSSHSFKGAVIGIDPSNPLARVIVFQSNLDTLTRVLEAQDVSGGLD